MSKGPLGLADEDFWGDYQKTRQETKTRILREGLHGLLMDAPEFVPLDIHETVPVVGWFVRTLREDNTLDTERQMLVAALDLETNRLRIGPALDTGKIAEPKTPVTTDPGEGLALNMFETELVRFIQLPKSAGQYRVAVIAREFISNAVTVQLGASLASFQDPEVIRFLEERRKYSIPPPPDPIWPPLPGQGGLLPSYRSQAGSPPVPEKPGIAFSVERVVVTEPGASCVLRGSYRLPVLRQEVVRTDKKTGMLPKVGDPAATAVLTINLVMTGSDSTGPYVIRLHVPSYETVERKGRTDYTTGFFNLDLFQLDGMPRMPMTYFLYAFCGDVVSGPTPIALISSDMLPYRKE
jgi:hypothetical protein